MRNGYPLKTNCHNCHLSHLSHLHKSLSPKRQIDNKLQYHIA